MFLRIHVVGCVGPSFQLFVLLVELSQEFSAFVGDLETGGGRRFLHLCRLDYYLGLHRHLSVLVLHYHHLRLLRKDQGDPRSRSRRRRRWVSVASASVGWQGRYEAVDSVAKAGYFRKQTCEVHPLINRPEFRHSRLLLLFLFLLLLLLLVLVLLLILIFVLVLVFILSVFVLLLILLIFTFLIVFLFLVLFIFLFLGGVFLLVTHLTEQKSIQHLISFKMNIYSIKEEGQALEEIGVVLDTPERMKLELGLIKLSELANADQLLFWGKVTTTASPYYIAVAIDFKGHYAFPHKKFYYSKDNFEFTQLPAPDQFNKNNANQFNTLPFSGNPQNVLINCQPEGEEKKPEKAEEVDSDEEEVVKVEPKNYLEEDRLSYTVHSIEEECQLVPLGSFRMIPCHQIRYNQEFKGVNERQFCNNFFRHFRYPKSASAKKKIESVDAVFNLDLLDHIQNNSYWSAQANTALTFGTVRSLLWPGYIAYASFKRPAFGGVYCGNGLKQTELPFFL